MISLQEKYPRIAAEFDVGLNGMLPSEIAFYSSQKVGWICQKDKSHKWPASVHSRTRKDSDCPFCTNRRVSATNSLSFLFPEISLDWDYEKNILTPEQIVSGSAKKVFWCCDHCGHKWDAEVRCRTDKNHGCPACNNKIVTENNCLAVTHSHLIKEWSDKNILTPHQVVSGSKKVVIWHCDICHYEWKSRVMSRACEDKNCRKCGDVKKSEKMTDLIVSGWDGYKSKYNNGHYYSKKNNKELFYRSSYERDAFIILESRIDVAFYESEPLKIPYLYNENKRNYVPDILIHYISGEKQFIEIKPINFLNHPKEKELIMIKFAALVEFSKTNRYKTPEIWSEPQLT